jgi:hypothetical protein
VVKPHHDDFYLFSAFRRILALLLFKTLEFLIHEFLIR